MNEKPKSIGVIGGMGALASADFVSRFMMECALRGAENDSDFPHLILENIPFSGSDELGCGNTDLALGKVREAVDRMNNAGIELIVAVCNTIHLHIDQVLDPKKDPQFLDIVDSAVEDLMRQNAKRVLILSSEESSNARLYSDRLYEKELDFWEINRSFYPEQQDMINSAIKLIMRGNYQGAKHVLEAVIRPFTNQIDSVVLGCTELPLAQPQVRGVKIIDPNQILVQRLACEAYRSNLCSENPATAELFIANDSPHTARHKSRVS